MWNFIYHYSPITSNMFHSTYYLSNHSPNYIVILYSQSKTYKGYKIIRIASLAQKIENFQLPCVHLHAPMLHAGEVA